jgi:5'-phosphate synthase pdxT subunit
MNVGVIAIQGDFEKHIQSLERCKAANLTVHEVRTPEELETVDRVILPGGESTTVGLLMQRFGLGDALKQAADNGMPMWGTCMGMIMLAQRIEAREQYTLGILDIESEVPMHGLGEPVLGVFIRAPIVTQLGPDVQVLAEIENKIVAVKQGNILGTSFHPELTDDIRLHQWFLNL